MTFMVGLAVSACQRSLAGLTRGRGLGGPCRALSSCGSARFGGKGGRRSPGQRPCRRFGLPADRVAPHEPALLPLDRECSRPDRRADGTQHLVQRERAGGLPAAGSVGLLPADQDGRPNSRQCHDLEGCAPVVAIRAARLLVEPDQSEARPIGSSWVNDLAGACIPAVR
jgi:hypothetical protein